MKTVLIGIAALFAIVGLSTVRLWCLTLLPPGYGRRDLTVALRVPQLLRRLFGLEAA